VSSKRFVYVLRTCSTPSRSYVGVTANVRAQLQAHNEGRHAHTARHRPWRLHVVVAFAEEAASLRFERYLKSGTGRAFTKDHFE
jgi:predicted GIY-YIG superfamily endonuclease